MLVFKFIYPEPDEYPFDVHQLFKLELEILEVVHSEQLPQDGQVGQDGQSILGIKE